MDVVTVVRIRLGRFTAFVKLDTSLGLMERLVTIIMSAQRTVMAATIFATILLVPSTAVVMQAMNRHLIKRLVSISMSACVTLTTVLRYVGTPQDLSHVVVTIGVEYDGAAGACPVSFLLKNPEYIYVQSMKS